MKLTELQQIVFDQLGSESEEEFKETLQDVARHGGDTGYSGFTYSSDCYDFFNENRDLINKELAETASALGEGKLEMIAGFNCLGKDYTTNEIGKALYDKTHYSELSQIYDALAWWCLETVAFQFDC